jgi:glutamate N-acetyltransferase / amino-acid N-acetyltransferase
MILIVILASLSLLILEVSSFSWKVDGFRSQSSYLDHLRSIGTLPEGFSVGITRFKFRPFEVDKILPMNLTLIVLDEPTDSFAASLTSNAFPGGPIYCNRDRMKNSKYLQAVVINNKISNVCPGGVEDFGRGDSEAICSAVAKSLKLPSSSHVFPSSTGIIGKYYINPILGLH